MKRLFVIIVMILMSVGIAHGQSAQDALEALKKLQSRTQVGISYKDYGPALGETHYKVKLFLDNPESNKNPLLKKAISKALDHFTYANDVWKTKIENGSDHLYRVVPEVGELKQQFEYEKKIADRIVKDYPGVYKTMGDRTDTINLSNVISVIWNEAAKEIETATKLVKSNI